MGIREQIQKHKWMGGVILVIGVIAWMVTVRKLQHDNRRDDFVQSVYFSADDGKTYFADQVSKGFSFNHGGKLAYRAFVYRCGSKSPFVGLLARSPDDTSPTTSPASNSNNKPAGPPASFEVRKPGTTNWVPYTSTEAQAWIRSLCPDGVPESVLP